MAPDTQEAPAITCLKKVPASIRQFADSAYGLRGWEALSPDRFESQFINSPARVVAIERDDNQTVALLGYFKNHTGHYRVAAVRLDEARVGTLTIEMELNRSALVGHYVTPQKLSELKSGSDDGDDFERYDFELGARQPDRGCDIDF